MDISGCEKTFLSLTGIAALNGKVPRSETAEVNALICV